MPIKFSQFTNRTSDTATTTIVGFDGNQNIKILSSDLLSGFINGTADTIPVFATANTLGDSIITQDNPATTVTIGGALSVTSGITGDLTGDVTGDVTGNLTGNVTGNLTGNVTGNVTGDLTGDVTGNVTGNVTGSASLNVLKSGDTMTGDLSITSSSSGERKIVIGNTDGSQTTNDYSKIHLTGKSTASSSTTGAEVVLNTGGSGLARVRFNTAYDFNSTDSYRTGNIGYNGGSNGQFYIQHGPPTSSKNTITLDQLYTYFNTPLRIGADASANELDDYEEGSWTPTIFGFMGGMANTSYSYQYGSYTKIGNLVRAFFSLTFTSTINPGYTINIAGLPFTPESGGTGESNNFLFSVGNKVNVDFVYSAGVGRVSLSVIGARKGVTSSITIACDDGTSIDNLTTDALTGSSSSSMTLSATMIYKTTY